MLLQGPDHSDVADCSTISLANLAEENDRYAEAERLAKRALAIRQKTYGKEHATIVEAMVALASSLRGQGNS